jgi:eukaryotic-like serine/threonine-protein kinase
VQGTAAYLAPEQFTGDRASPASDLYALGIVGYECLTGTRPFRGEPIEIAGAHRDRPLPVTVPPAAAALLAKLAAKDPAARPRDAALAGHPATLVEALPLTWHEAHLGPGPPASRTPARSSRYSRADRSRRASR